MTLNKVKDCFEKSFALKPDQFTVDLVPDDVPSWDSLGHMRLITELQQTFGLEFEVDEIMEMDSVKKIVTCLEKRGLPA